MLAADKLLIQRSNKYGMREEPGRYCSRVADLDITTCKRPSLNSLMIERCQPLSLSAKLASPSASMHSPACKSMSARSLHDGHSISSPVSITSQSAFKQKLNEKLPASKCQPWCASPRSPNDQPRQRQPSIVSPRSSVLQPYHTSPIPFASLRARQPSALQPLDR